MDTEPKHTCPVCSKAAPMFVKNGTGRIFFQCPACGYIFADPEEERLGNEREREFFKDQWERSPTGGNPGCYPTLLSLAQSSGIPSLKVLDFGCGDGGLLRFLRGNGIPAYGVDRVPVENDMRPFVFRDLSGLPEMKFDIITSVEVFEHLPNPGATLEALLERLSPEGFLFLTTALTNRSMAHIKYFPFWIYQKDRTHIGFFAERTMKFLAHENGLELQVFGYGDFILDRSKKRLVVQQEGRFVFAHQDRWEANY